MCGILACVYCEDVQKSALKEVLLPLLCRRGPDRTGEVTTPLGASPPLWLDLVGTLLHMRGGLTPQPLRNGKGDYLLWNGNVFGGGIDIRSDENDTVKVMEELEHLEGDHDGILYTMSKVHGPWAFVYWQSSSTCLWFGRDVFGRRSLLWHLPTSGSDVMAISSVGCRCPPSMPQGYWSEIPAGVYCLRITGGMMSSLVHYPWMQGDRTFQEMSFLVEELQSHGHLPIKITENISLQVPFSPLNRLIIDPTLVVGALGMDPSSPKSDILTLAGATSSTGATNLTTTSSTGATDLTATSSTGAPDLTAASSTGATDLTATSSTGATDLTATSSTGATDLTATSSTGATDLTATSSTGLTGSSGGMGWSSIARAFLEVLQLAVKRRVDRAPFPSRMVTRRHSLTDLGPSHVDLGPSHMHSDMESGPSPVVPRPCHEDLHVVSEPSQSATSVALDSYRYMHGRRGFARVAILFSGGLDSTVLAALTDRCLDPKEEIDLINVAFEQKRTPNSETISFDVPDRLSAIQSLKELNPHRTWNLVLVDVTQEELNHLRKDHISHLVYPLCTVLDDSIGCALWFAARGKGMLYCHGNQTDVGTHYTSTAKTLFIGIGADEQMGGYARHRTKFRSEGWEGLVKEVEMETKRLSKRNLGRDDRCVADHQRDGQFPFLDETVVDYLQRLPMTSKLDLTLPRGVGEKRLLREVATILGCHVAAMLPKRAIQFGSRMAKAAGSSNGRELGSDVCNRLLSSDD